MTEKQALLPYAEPEEERDEVTREAHANDVALATLVMVLREELHRKSLCYALEMSEGELSKRLSGADGKRPCYRMLLYVLRHEKMGRLAALLARQAGYLPPRRPDALDDKEFRDRAEEVFKRNGEAGEAIRRQILGDRAVRKIGSAG